MVGTHETVLALTCPACQGDGTFQTWDCIDGTQSPELRQRILTDETLFFYECPQCHEAIHVESPCLYINRQEQWMVWHIPDPKIPVTSREVCNFLGEDSFDEYVCRAALTWGEWREKIIEMESTYDDRLYEIIKYGAYRLVKEADRKKLPLESYHLDYTDEARQKDKLSLVFMEQERRGMGYTYEITPKVREITEDIFLPVLKKLPNMNGKGKFERFGYSWAEHMMTYMMQAASSGAGKQIYGQLLGFWIQTLGKELFHADIKA